MGPLDGIRLVEIAGIGPTQFCGMLLADMGASIIRIQRPGGIDAGVGIPPRFNLMNRSRPAIDVDLKSAAGLELVLTLCETADGIYEGFRPGVMERAGLGPAECTARNPRLVYGRMTGYGQHGPYAAMAGHDTNYIALAGALHGMGSADRPPPVPLNLVGDFGGGGAFLALGMLAAIIEAGRSGLGQVVDAAMVDGAASMTTLFHGLMAAGLWRDRRESNLLDGAAPFFRVYETADERFVAVCAIEPAFFEALLALTGVEKISAAQQFDTSDWPRQAEVLAATFRSRTRDQWTELATGTDACVAPVLSLEEAPGHPHNVAREVFVDVDGVTQPAPAPRFSRTPASVSRPAAKPETDVAGTLVDWGVDSQAATGLARALRGE